MIWAEYVGQHYKGWNSEVYKIESHDPAAGFHLVNVNDAADKRCISERAIGRTFHRRWWDEAGQQWVNSRVSSP